MGQFTDLSSSTPLDAAHLDALVVAGSYLVSGGVPSTGASLTVTQPATAVVISTGANSALSVPAGGGTLGSTPLALVANSDNYVDLDTSGTYHYGGGLSVAVNAAAPALTANSIRLYKATTSGTAVTAVTQLAGTKPLPQSQVQVDTTEASAFDTLAVGGNGLLVNLNRLRNQLGVVIGGAGSAWNAAVQMIPASLLGAANGVPTLGSSSHVQQQAIYDPTEASTFDTLGVGSSIVNNLNRLRNQLGVVVGNAGASWDAAVQMLPLSQKGAASGVAALNGSSQLMATATAGALTINGTTTLAGHVVSSGATPTVAKAPGATWIVGTPAIGGNDRRCTVNISASAWSAGDQFTVTFATPYASTPTVQLTAQGNWAGCWISAISTTGFTVAFPAGALPGSGLMGVVCTIEQ